MNLSTSSDNDFELRGVFLDIHKAFDEMWHDGIICQLKQNGIKGKLLYLLMDFLKNLQKSCFEWSVLIMDKGEYRHSTGNQF